MKLASKNIDHCLGGKSISRYSPPLIPRTPHPLDSSSADVIIVIVMTREPSPNL